MASVTPEAFVLCSGVRSGFKREFAFALKAQAEMLMTPASRTRSGKVRQSSAAPSREPAAKRRRKSAAAGALPPPTASAPSEDCLILPVPAVEASLEVGPVAVAAMAVHAVPEEMEVGVPNAAIPRVQLDRSLAENFVPIQIPSGSAAEMVCSKNPMEGTAVADTGPSIQVDAKPITEMPQTIQTEMESIMDIVPSILVEVRPVIGMPRTTQSKAESKMDTVPSIRVYAKRVMEMRQAVKTEVKSMTDAASSDKVDGKSVTEMPQTVQTEVESITDTASSVQIDAKHVMRIPRTVQTTVESKTDIAFSIQVDAKPVMEVTRTIQTEARTVTDTASSVQLEVTPVEDIPQLVQTVVESITDTVSPVQLEAKPVTEMPQTVQTEVESIMHTASSVQVDAKPVMEMPQTFQTEVESKTDTASSVQVDVKPVMEMPQSIQTEAKGVTDATPSFQLKVTPVAEMLRTAWSVVDSMMGTVPSVQVDPKPAVDVPQAIWSKVECTTNTVASVQVEARPVMEIPATDIENHVSQKARENVVLQKPMRRFTRSLLRSPAEEPRLPMVEESSQVPMAENSPGASSGSDGLDEIKGTTSTMNGVGKPLSMTPNKMELKMSKKITSSKFPSTIKGLLATGLLEGLTVKYGFGKQERIRGMIKDGGILCFCASCEGSNIISSYNFELHAGSRKKNPSHFIYLENGNTMYDILKACSSAPLETLEATLQNAISSEGSRSLSYDRHKDSYVKLYNTKLGSMSDSCLQAKSSPTSSNLSQESTSAARWSRSIFSPESSHCTSRSISSQKNSRGRMTQKDLRLHKLVFKDDILPNGTEVAYYSCGQRVLEGYIKNSGIFCHCCKTVISPSQFEAHAGFPSRRKPYLNIYTSNGVSLHELSISLSKDKRFSANKSDDLCRICADGGDLLPCDICPRAFHKECIGLTSVPKGDWYCPCCRNSHVKDKAVGHNKNAIAAGRILGVDPIEQIFNRCIRIVKMPEADLGGCVFCRCHDFRSGFGPRTVLLCDQCEREFHVGCLKEHNMGDLEELPEDKWFCSSDCGRIHSALQNLLACGSQQLPFFHSDLIKKKQEQKGLVKEMDLDVRWRLLSGKTASPETRLLLSQALSIFHESFGQIIDFATSKDFIHAMVYGREIRDQDFGGMYCAVLTVNSFVVSAAILRVLGCEVAELPLVATSRESQGKGYFQSLFSSIERMLDSLKVNHLVLPAADEAESIWTNKFGFSKISLDQMPEYMKGFHMMIFEGTSTLHKLVPKSETDV